MGLLLLGPGRRVWVKILSEEDFKLFFDFFFFFFFCIPQVPYGNASTYDVVPFFVVVGS